MGLALVGAAAYCAVTLPAGAGLGFAAVETLGVAFGGLALWGVCTLALKYKMPALQLFGAWFYLALVLICLLLALGLGLFAAAATRVLAPFVGELLVKAFCLLALYGATVLGSLLRALKQAEVEAPQEDLPRALPPQEPQVEPLRRISIKFGNDIRIVDVEEIIYLKAEGDYVSIVTAGGKFLKEQTMKYFAEALPRDRFIRIHRSYIIHVKYLMSIERYGESQMVLMTGGEKIRISATGYKVLKERLGL